MFRKILVPVDFSDVTSLVIKHLKKTVDCAKEIILLHVVDVRIFNVPIYLEAPELNDFIIDKTMLDSIKERLNKLKKDLEKAGFTKVKVVVEEGIPFDVILDTAEKKKVSAIFLGHQGHNAMERMLLGSTAEKVARKAKVPVILVK